MLTAEQLQALRLALSQQGAGAAGRKVLSEHQIDELKKEAANYRQAQKQAAEAIGVLWNARLDLAINSGDVEGINKVMNRPVAFYDNCSCSGGGGTSYW